MKRGSHAPQGALAYLLPYRLRRVNLYLPLAALVPVRISVLIMVDQRANEEEDILLRYWNEGLN